MNKLLDVRVDAVFCLCSTTRHYLVWRPPGNDRPDFGGRSGVLFRLSGHVAVATRMAGMLVMLLQRAAVATDRLYEIYDAEPEISDSPRTSAAQYLLAGFEAP
ncbi:MAG: hypothetical protein ACNYPE_03455 [Candidatus Azotimanducaceae bacterium WSBS_2022_MAG_OTU7]